MKKRRPGRSPKPSPLAGEGGERHRRESGEGSGANSPSALSLAPAPPGETGKTSANRICVAKFGAAHGVRGEIRLWPFTEEPLGVTSYGPLETQDGARRFEIASARPQKDHLVARVKGVETREAAELLNGLDLYVAREKLPATETDEFYHADLIGLAAETERGNAVGRIVAVHNFGAGDIIEIARAKGGETLMLPFTNAIVPTVDLAAGVATVVLPDEIEGEEQA